ncbi:MAG: hypothetical protein VW270_01580 [Candidatus Poseidoniales archaeon]|jgi:hypothetical protein
MKIKIIYTGNPEETQVIDTETGKVIQNIIGVDVALDPFGGYAALTFKDFEVEMDNVEVVDGNTQQLQ